MEDLIYYYYSFYSRGNSKLSLSAPTKYIVLSSKEHESRDNLSHGYVLFLSISFNSLIYVIFLLNIL